MQVACCALPTAHRLLTGLDPHCTAALQDLGWWHCAAPVMLLQRAKYARHAQQPLLYGECQTCSCCLLVLRTCNAALPSCEAPLALYWQTPTGGVPGWQCQTLSSSSVGCHPVLCCLLQRMPAAGVSPAVSCAAAAGRPVQWQGPCLWHHSKLLQGTAAAAACS
jgi:hypothetical protein